MIVLKHETHQKNVSKELLNTKCMCDVSSFRRTHEKHTTFGRKPSIHFFLIQYTRNFILLFQFDRQILRKIKK